MKRESGISGIFEGKVALVTGAAQGIGKATCITLAKAGAAVAVHYRSRDAAANAAVREIQAIGRPVVAVKGDLSNAEEAAGVVEAVERELGPVSLLVNNAGRFKRSTADDETPEHHAAVFRDNVQTLFNATWAVHRSMLKARYGRIVNVSSTAAFLGARGAPPSYSAAKAAVVALTKAWAGAWGGHNIRVNCVAPGYIDTEANAGIPADAKGRLIAETPLGRIGTPAEVAEAIAFLLSDSASFINGQTLAVCGGRVTLP